MGRNINGRDWGWGGVSMCGACSARECARGAGLMKHIADFCATFTLPIFCAVVVPTAGRQRGGRATAGGARHAAAASLGRNAAWRVLRALSPLCSDA